MIRSLLMTAALLAPLAAASAQPPAPDAATIAQHQQARAARQQEMAQDLAIVLRLTPAQQPALAAWLQAMTPPHDWQGGRDRGGEDQAGNTPERLAAQQQRAAAHQAEDATRIAATQRFYAQLDPQQRGVFDALDRLRHDQHRGPHGGGRRDGGGPGAMPPGGAG